jgi:hypothetical protein
MVWIASLRGSLAARSLVSPSVAVVENEEFAQINFGSSGLSVGKNRVLIKRRGLF